MFLIPLILGLVAMQFPFIAAILLWIYMAKTAVVGIQSPLMVLGPFFVVPLVLILVDNATGTALQGLDSILGVGIPALVFLLCLIRQQRTTTSLACASGALVLYGSARAYFFAEYLQQVQIAVQDQLNQMVPELMAQDLYAQSMSLMTYLMPGFWIAFQVVAMIIGLVLFHRQLALPFLWNRIQFPWQYNLLFILGSALYLIPGLQAVFITAILGLSVLPMMQGISLLISYLSRFIMNKVMRAIILVAMLINSISFIILALIGFIDIWFNLRKIETGGSPA